MSEPSPALPARRGLFVLYLLIALALLSAGYLFSDKLGLLLHHIEEGVRLMGPAAPFAMTAVCGIWGTLCLPGPLLQGAVATMFSTTPWIALGVVVAGEMIAQATSFTLARHWGRERVRNRLSGQAWFQRLEIQTEKRGVQGVFLFRLMPFFPNALASYAFGLTRLQFVPYLLASGLGSVPKMVLYIFGTTSLVNWLRSGAMSPRALIATVTLLILVTVLARWWQRRLSRELADETDPFTASDDKR